MNAWLPALCIALFIVIICLLTIIWVLQKANKKMEHDLSELLTHPEYDEKNQRQYELANHWLWLNYRQICLRGYLEYNNLRSVAIYGAGELGLRLMEELGKDVAYFIDQNPGNAVCDKSLIKKPENLTRDDMVDAIIVTPIIYFEAIKKNLSILPFESEVISLEDMVFGVSDYYAGGE